jgi:hypothetical protein
VVEDFSTVIAALCVIGMDRSSVTGAVSFESAVTTFLSSADDVGVEQANSCVGYEERVLGW